MLTIKPMPGKWARLLHYGGKHQKRYVGPLISLVNSAHANAELEALRTGRCAQATHLDIFTSPDPQARPVKTIELPPLGGLGGTDDDLSPFTSTAALVPAGAPAYPAPAAYAPAQQGDAGMQSFYTQHLLQNAEQRVTDAREQLAEVRDQLRIERDTNRRQAGELADTNIQLKTIQRQHELELQALRQQLEADAEPAPRGLAGLTAGLPPEASSALMTGLLGIAQKFMGLGDAPAAGNTTPALMPAENDQHRQLLQGILDMLPTTEQAAQVYALLSNLLPKPGALKQLLMNLGILPAEAT